MATFEDQAPLDFCSEEFDPLKALNAKESLISLPYPEVLIHSIAKLLKVLIPSGISLL